MSPARALEQFETFAVCRHRDIYSVYSASDEPAPAWIEVDMKQQILCAVFLVALVDPVSACQHPVYATGNATLCKKGNCAQVVTTAKTCEIHAAENASTEPSAKPLPASPKATTPPQRLTPEALRRTRLYHEARQPKTGAEKRQLQEIRNNAAATLARWQLVRKQKEQAPQRQPKRKTTSRPKRALTVEKVATTNTWSFTPSAVHNCLTHATTTSLRETAFYACQTGN